jgi:hypothetical protein
MVFKRHKSKAIAFKISSHEFTNKTNVFIIYVMN